MTQDLLAANIKELKRVLRIVPKIHYATLFGSSIKNRLTAESDIDVAVAADRPLENKLYLQWVDSLNSVLSHPVDLIDLNRVSGPILKQALCTGIVVKKTSALHLAQLIKKMWYNQADMMPNSLMILKSHCERFIDG
jgi:predicted nucleotidyltransferase